MSQVFKRNIENFTCEHCGAEVTGNGYTNHCPKCLWSKHVDVHPGDRAETCGGMMKPMGVEVRGKKYEIRHKCTKCRAERTVKSVEGDNLSVLTENR